MPKLRQGGRFPGVPGFLEAGKTSEPALVSLTPEAWAGGASTRRVDEQVQAMGPAGMSKSTASNPCEGIDDRAGECLNCPLTGAWPHVFLDAACVRVRQGKRIVPVGAMIALVADTDRRRETTGLGIGPSGA